MSKSSGIGVGTGIFLIAIILCCVVGALFYFNVLSIKDIKKDITDMVDFSDNSNISITTPPVEYDWCRVQDMQDSSIIGWDSTEECCVREWTGNDACLQKNITIHSCFVGTVGTIYKWSKVNGYYTNEPTDYQYYIKVMNLDTIPTNMCRTLIYPSKVDQRLNEDNNYEMI